MLDRLRRAMVRPGRDLLSGRVEVDECYVGGPEENLPGRLNLDKTLVVVAAEEDGPGIGRIRMRQISNASSASLVPFVEESVASGSVVHTDGWLDYSPLESKGFPHQVTYLKGKPGTASEMLPRVHLVISLLKRRLMGTHQGAVSHTWTTIWTSSRFASTGAYHGAGESCSTVWRNRRSLFNLSLATESFTPMPKNLANRNLLACDESSGCPFVQKIASAITQKRP